MAPPAKTPSQIIEEMDRLYGAVEMGAAADKVLQLLDPIIEKRLGELLNRLEQCPPEIGPILDIRAKICETWRMRKQVKERQSMGKTAVTVIKGLFEVETIPLNGPITGQH